MPIKVEKTPDGSAIVCTFEGAVTIDELREVQQKSLELAQTMPNPAPRVNNVLPMEVNFSQLVMLMGDMIQLLNEPGGVNDPRFRNIIVVAPNSMAQLGAEGIQQEQYGAMPLNIVTTMEEALTWAREG